MWNVKSGNVNNRDANAAAEEKQADSTDLVSLPSPNAIHVSADVGANISTDVVPTTRDDDKRLEHDKKQMNRIIQDGEWEAVSGFYTALNMLMCPRPKGKTNIGRGPVTMPVILGQQSQVGPIGTDRDQPKQATLSNKNRKECPSDESA